MGAAVWGYHRYKWSWLWVRNPDTGLTSQGLVDWRKEEPWTQAGHPAPGERRVRLRGPTTPVKFEARLRLETLSGFVPKMGDAGGMTGKVRPLKAKRGSSPPVARSI